MAIFEDDPFGKVKNENRDPWPEPREVNDFHTRADVDESVFSLHHTLGIAATQAAPGDHVHDGRASRLVGAGKGESVTGSKGSNDALADLIRMLQQFIDFEDNTT